MLVTRREALGGLVGAGLALAKPAPAGAATPRDSTRANAIADRQDGVWAMIDLLVGTPSLGVRDTPGQRMRLRSCFPAASEPRLTMSCGLHTMVLP